MVRPRVARGFVGAGFFGLAPMYQASKWSSCAPDHHGYPLALRSHKGEYLDGPNVPSGFGCAGKTVLHLFRYLSQTSAGKGLAADHAMCSSSSGPVPWFVLAAVPLSRPCSFQLRRAQASSRLARQGHPKGLVLTKPSTARGSGWLGRIGHALADLKIPTVVHKTPQAMRASLLASAIASLLGCKRFPAYIDPVL